MKIGIDARLWNESGVGRYIRNLIKNFPTDTNHNFVLFTGKKSKNLPKSNHFKIVHTSAKWHSWEEQFKFLKSINSQNLDLMHFTYHSFPFFYNLPFVITIHDLIIYHHSTGKASTKSKPEYLFKKYIYKKMLKRAVKNANKIITPTETVKKDIVNTLNASSNKIEPIFEATDDSITRVEKKTDYNYFLYVGNAYPHKNVQSLIKAFIELRNEQTIDCKLVLVGPNDFFYRSIEKNLPDDLKVLHNVSDNKLSELYSNSIALIHPSFAEGFGLTLLEAMKCKTPVAASNISALREVCQDHAVYFNPENIDEIKKAMSSLYNWKGHTKVEKLLKAQNHAKKFSWTKASIQTIKVYEDSISL